jgi:transcription initiation factor TFIIH subunit 1
VASPSPSPAQPTPPPQQISSPPVTPTPPNGVSRSGRQEEFNDRRQLLSSSRELHNLHMELVVMGKSVDEEEFWSSPYVKRIRQVKC